MNLWAKEEDLTVYWAEALGTLSGLPDDYVDAVLTSPPYVDMRPEYGTPTEWVPIFAELLRVVDGPMLWNVGRRWIEGCEDMWWLSLIDSAKAAGWEHWDTLVWFKPNANPIQGRVATNSHEYVLAFGQEGAEFDEEARRRPYAIGSAERLRRRWVSSISTLSDVRGEVHGSSPTETAPPFLQSNLFQSLDSEPAPQAHEDEEGLRAPSSTGSSGSHEGWLRDGAPRGDGARARSLSEAERGSASPQSSEGRQPRGEPEGHGEARPRLDAQAASSAGVSTLRGTSGSEVQEPACPECGGRGYRRPGVILDPFAGSGTTAIAARMRQCNSVLIEEREDYCQEIVRRLSAVPRQMTLLP